MSKRKSSNNTAGLDFVINTSVEGIKGVETELEKLRKKIEDRPIRQKVIIETADKNTTNQIVKANKTILSQKKEEAKLSKSALARQRAGRGTRRPFEAMMMGIGSFMLLKYAVQVPFLWASALGDAMANVETESRKGHAYRQSLGARGIGASAFDTAVARYSELSGEQGYKSRVRIASLYGQLEQRGTSIGSLNPKAIANVLQGLTAGMGLSDEQADKKLIELLTGKISKEDKKTFGIKSRTPVQILEEINSTLLKNPVIASTMTGKSASSDMKFIRGAKNELLSRINDLWPSLFTDITNPMKEFFTTFFGLDNKNIKAEWITTLATIRDQIEKVFTKEHAKKLAKGVNRFVSIFSMVTGFIADQVLDHPIISTILAGVGLFNKSRTGSFLGIEGGLFNKIFGKDGVVKVFVTNKDGVFSKVSEFASIFSGIVAPAIAGAILAVIVNRGISSFYNNFNAENALLKAEPLFASAGLNDAQKKEYKERVKRTGYIEPNSYIREVIGEDRYAKFQNRQYLAGKDFKKAMIATFGEDINDINNIGYNSDFINKFRNMAGNKSNIQTTYNIGTVNVEGKTITNDQLINSVFGGAY